MVPGNCSSVTMTQVSTWSAALVLSVISSMVGMMQPLPYPVHLEIPNTGLPLLIRELMFLCERAGFNLPENFAARDAYDDARYRKNNWSIGVRHSFDKTSVGVGTDSEDGLAVGVGTELSGLSTFIFMVQICI